MWVVNHGDSTLMKVSPSSGSVVATVFNRQEPVRGRNWRRASLGVELRQQFRLPDCFELNIGSHKRHRSEPQRGPFVALTVPFCG